MHYGRPTGAAMPLMWAHAEYIKLLRSAAAAEVFDLLPEVARRYRIPHKYNPIEYWKPNRRIKTMASGVTLRIQAQNPFRLHWSVDEWSQVTETMARTNALKIHYADIAVAKDQKSPVRFTFFWVTDGKWEGRDYMVEIKSPDRR